MSKKTIINEGGIAGSGKGIVRTQEADFQDLQAKILEQSRQRSRIGKLEDQLLTVRFRMEDYLAERKPAEVLPPGAFLKSCLEILDIKNKDFAAYVGFEESNLSDLIKGRRKINPEFALKLGKIFNISPRLWLDIQNKNELLTLNSERSAETRQFGLGDLLAKSGRHTVAS